MSEENNEKKKNPWDNTIKYEFDAARQKEEIYKSTLEYFKQSKKAQKYFQNFSPHSIKSTLEMYAWQKAGWLINKDRAEYWHDYAMLQCKNEAEECLGNIQQKKLFNKQCEWRAELFTHPAIVAMYDFKYWEHNILNCPFIDPITSDDVELYIEFMNEYFGENLAFLGSWQDYDTYCTNNITVLGEMNKHSEDEDDDDDDGEESDNYDLSDDDEFAEEEEKGRLMPPWYEFWDQRRGAGSYLMLPDIRREKELAYSRLAAAEERKMWEEKFKAEPPDKRLPLDLWREKAVPFIEEYENPAEKDKVLKARETHQKIYNNKEEEDAMYWVKEAWEDLRDCYEPFPLTPGITDWKKALIATAKKWNHTKITRMIPVVYDEYLFRMQTGIAHPFDSKQAETYREMAEQHKAKILRGREIKGEPKDFNF